MNRLKGNYLELIFWIAALILLSFSDPYARHFTLCPLANLGASWCPGCGIGHAISHLLRGNIAESFREHWFGIPALLILTHRIYSLSAAILKQKAHYKFK